MFCLSLPQMAWTAFFPLLLRRNRESNSCQFSCTSLRNLNSGCFTDWATAAAAKSGTMLSHLSVVQRLASTRTRRELWHWAVLREPRRLSASRCSSVTGSPSTRRWRWSSSASAPSSLTSRLEKKLHSRGVCKLNGRQTSVSPSFGKLDHFKKQKYFHAVQMQLIPKRFKGWANTGSSSPVRLQSPRYSQCLTDTVGR